MRLARALRAERLDLEIVLLEDADVLAERRRLVLPVVDLADGDLQRVLRRGLRGAERERGQRAADAEYHLFLPFGFFFAPTLLRFAAAFAGTGCRAAASTARSIGSDLPRPSRSASRRTQYS